MAHQFGSGTTNAILMTWGMYCPEMGISFISGGNRTEQLNALVKRYEELPPLVQNALLLKYTKRISRHLNNEFTQLIYPEIKKWGKDVKLFKDMVMAMELERQ
jgi:hypothetical protein